MAEKQRPCPGPMVWFSVDPTDLWPEAAILECSTCRTVITTGNFFDGAHAATDILREGIPS